MDMARLDEFKVTSYCSSWGGQEMPVTGVIVRHLPCEDRKGCEVYNGRFDYTPAVPTLARLVALAGRHECSEQT